MGPSGPAPKRRRLDSALHKPFRSPLKTTQANNSNSPTSPLPTSTTPTAVKIPPKTPARAAVRPSQTPANHSLHRPFTPSTLAQTSTLTSSTPTQPSDADNDNDEEMDLSSPEDEEKRKRKYSHDTPMKSFSQQSSTTSSQTSTDIYASQEPTTTPHRLPASRPIRRTAPSATHPAALSTQTPELQSLEQEIRALEAETRGLRNQIDTLRQAEGLPASAETGSKESGEAVSRLTQLIQKWKMVSQEAAEEVFTDVRTRVKEIVGMKGYRRGERERAVVRKKEDWEFMKGDEGFARGREDWEEEEGKAGAAAGGGAEENGRRGGGGRV